MSTLSPLPRRCIKPATIVAAEYSNSDVVMMPVLSGLHHGLGFERPRALSRIQV